MKILRISGFVILLLSYIVIDAAAQPAPAKPLKYGAQHVGKRDDAAMQKFRENRFGQFIHWGLYSVPAGEWNGKVYPGASEWLKASAHIPRSEWNLLISRFNPKDFDPQKWAKQAKKLGVRYMTITTKHHDGFCLWPSAYTEFNISNSPYMKDIIGALIDAYNREGIDVYLYYSILDWNNPDWRYDLNNKDDSTAFNRFLQFSYNQLSELATSYPTVKGFWFDGTWDNSMKKSGRWTFEVEKMLKEKIPGCIVSSRLRADEFGRRGRDSNGMLMGDYESGYERKLPAITDTNIVKVDWEACFTIPVNQWGYHKDWSLSHVKSAGEILENIAYTISMGGNFLLNFGPTERGVFRSEEQKLMEEIGSWMKKNGEAIYGCDHTSLQKQDWGYYTFNPQSGYYYLVVVNIPVYQALKVKLPHEYGVETVKVLDNSIGIRKVEAIDGSDYLIHFTKRKKTDLPFVIKMRIGKAVKSNKFEEAKV